MVWTFAGGHMWLGGPTAWLCSGYIGRGGRTTDKANFALLLSELRSAFDAEGSATGKASENEDRRPKAKAVLGFANSWSPKIRPRSFGNGES